MNINSLYDLLIKGDKSAERQLFQKLSESFRLFVQQRIWNSEDGAEVVQEAMTTIAEKHRSIDFETSFAAWAYRVLENKILGFYRTKGRREDTFLQLPEQSVEFQTEDSNPILKHKLLECLEKLSRANIRQARILNLRYQGYSADEICEKLGVSKNNLYIILYRARSLLKSCLETGDIGK